MADPKVSITYEDMHAVHDHMGKTLRVSGMAIVEGGGVAVSLLPHRPGINQEILMLTLQVTITGESPSRQELLYELDLSEDETYTDVTFVLGGSVAADLPTTLKVEHVY